MLEIHVNILTYTVGFVSVRSYNCTVFTSVATVYNVPGYVIIYDELLSVVYMHRYLHVNDWYYFR